MHVALVTPEYPPLFQGGIGTYNRHLARILHRAGHEVTVVTAVAGDGGGDDGPRVVRLDTQVRKRLTTLAPAFGAEAKPVARVAAFGLAARDWLAANAEAFGIEVVEVPEYEGAAAFLIAEHLPAVVVTSHGSIGQVRIHTPSVERELHHDYRASLELMATATADAVASYGRRNQRDWQQYLERTVHYVVPPFVPTPPAGDLEPPRVEGLLGVVIGRLNEWKGVLESAEALARVRRAGHDVSLLWVGRDTPGPDHSPSVRQHLESRYPALWGKALLWRESLPPAEARALQARADFAMVPSRWDTFNFTAIEALSVGAPLIVSSGAGASDVCRDGEDALVVPPGDPDALAAAMERMTDPELRDRLRAAGPATLARELAPERVVSSRLAVYGEAVARHRERSRLSTTPALMNPFAWQWGRTAELSSAPAMLARLPSRLVVREALRRLPRVLRRLASRVRRR